jgi:hypothetical protein
VIERSSRNLKEPRPPDCVEGIFKLIPYMIFISSLNDYTKV